jgi:hypothetical protein
MTTEVLGMAASSTETAIGVLWMASASKEMTTEVLEMLFSGLAIINSFLE